MLSDIFEGVLADCGEEEEELESDAMESRDCRKCCRDARIHTHHGSRTGAPRVYTAEQRLSHALKITKSPSSQLTWLFESTDGSSGLSELLSPRGLREKMSCFIACFSFGLMIPAADRRATYVCACVCMCVCVCAVRARKRLNQVESS